MIINNNISAINTRNQLFSTNAATSKSMEKLSSGKRINRAADDAAGLSISEKMRAQIRGMNQATRNAQDGISLIQTAEGALDEVSNMLVRLKELNVQKLNGTYDTATDTKNLNLEINQLGAEITSIYTNTKFNGKVVLSTTAITLAISENGLVKLAVKGATLTAINSTSSVTNIESAITKVNELRATFGSQQNRLESTVRNLKTTAENLQAAESRIIRHRYGRGNVELYEEQHSCTGRYGNAGSGQPSPAERIVTIAVNRQQAIERLWFPESLLYMQRRFSYG